MPNHNRYIKMKEAGICAICCKEPVWRPRALHCRRCMDKVKKCNKDLRLRRKALHLCRDCGTKLELDRDEDCVSCLKCRMSHNQLSRRIYGNNTV
jgi:hypothetical protein